MLKSTLKTVFCIFHFSNIIFFVFLIFQIYMKKMVSNPSARYYQKIKKPFQKYVVKNIKLFLKKKNKKSDN